MPLRVLFPQGKDLKPLRFAAGRHLHPPSRAGRFDRVADEVAHCELELESISREGRGIRVLGA